MIVGAEEICGADSTTTEASGAGSLTGGTCGGGVGIFC